MKRIESRNNPTVKFINSLSAKKEREQNRLFYFEGVHLLEEYLRAGRKPYCVLVREDVFSRYEDLINSADCQVYEVTSSVYDKLTDEKAPQGIFTVSDFLPNVFYLDEINVSNIKGNSILLADLQDNGNVGTVIRTAAAMDCDVLLCGKCADIYSSKTVRATMGALFTNNVYLCDDTKKAVELLRNSGKRVIASALTDKAEILGRFPILENDCFAVGNEGQGLSKEVIASCDLTAIIPMSGKTESLNASIAASMLLWEAKRGDIV